MPLMEWIAHVPWLINVLQSRLFKSVAPSETDKVGLGRVMGFVVSLAVMGIMLTKDQNRERGCC